MPEIMKSNGCQLFLSDKLGKITRIMIWTDCEKAFWYLLPVFPLVLFKQAIELLLENDVVD